MENINMCLIAGGFLLLVFVVLLLRMRPEIEKNYDHILYKYYTFNQKKLRQISEEIMLNNGKIDKAKKFLNEIINLRKNAEKDLQDTFIKKEEDKLFITHDKNILSKKVEMLTQIEKQIDDMFENEIKSHLKYKEYFYTKNVLKRLTDKQV